MKNVFQILIVVFVFALGLTSCSKQSVVPGGDFETAPAYRDDLEEVEEGDNNLQTDVNDEDPIEQEDGDSITDDDDDEDDDDGGAERNVGV